MKNNILRISIFLITTLGFSQSKLVFTYDTAGNQVKREYCKDGDCNTKRQTAPEEEIKEEIQEEISELTEFDKSIAVFPNPTKGLLTINWNQEYSSTIKEIILIDVASKVYNVKYTPGNHQAKIDLSSWPDGLYVVRFFLTDGNSLTKKIIKK